MSTEIKVPVLPESVSDATVAAWHKKPGDSVRRDENLVDLETDKVVLEVPSPVAGVLKEIVSDSGATVTSDEVLAIIDEEAAGKKKRAGEQEERAKAKETEKEAGKEEPEAKKETEEAAEEEAEREEAEEKKAREEKEEKREEEPVGEREAERREAPDTFGLSPAVRRLVEEEGIDPSKVPATGRGGRLTKKDVVNYLKESGPAGARAEERVKMTRLRRRIAERMKEAQSTAAILTTFNEVDLKAVMDLRERYKEAFEKRHGVKLGIMSFFVKAACEALDRYPVVNASLEGEEIVYHGYMDIGIAVSTDRGLMVPVLRNAERMELPEIEEQVREYAQQARDGSIQLEDLQGGTFTITNGGVFGSMLSTPLLNPPQSAILGMHAIRERPVAIGGEIVVRPMMYLALSYDHRLIDGKDSVQFLVAVKETLEDPARMLLNL